MCHTSLQSGWPPSDRPQRRSGGHQFQSLRGASPVTEVSGGFRTSGILWATICACQAGSAVTPVTVVRDGTAMVLSWQRASPSQPHLSITFRDHGMIRPKTTFSRRCRLPSTKTSSHAPNGRTNTPPDPQPDCSTCVRILTMGRAIVALTLDLQPRLLTGLVPEYSNSVRSQ